MWTAESRAYVGDFGAGQALSDEQYARHRQVVSA